MHVASPVMAPLPANPNGRKLAVYAGSGMLPVQVAQNALTQGYEVYAFVMDKANQNAFKNLLGAERVIPTIPGLINQHFNHGKQLGIDAVVMAGKVNKWVLLKAPVLDKRALTALRQHRQLNDDALMLLIIREFEKDGFEVLKQTDFMQGLFIPPGVYSQRQPLESEWTDITYGLNTAKEMGRLDIGQTVVVSKGMIIAVEAIEGTDQAILRAKKWVGKNGGVVAKVEKPNQDKRFDVPTVGLQTLKSMKKAGLHILVFEADKTIALDFERMQQLANQWQMSLVAQ